ncbi:hypothetical protein FOPG_15139 [Fusarium oxysporum f. sp. conglutinans race 2 54008]|uniref:Uncharacterized protein n=1 Tax=Fusarium oxysporum f. sp. conglutinans race 2 54008 TaxID=1089457 RepID=X0GZL4_FUSOX|nr:hypothetical protein FOPG_15139 [Fusarium oxysporum f. sp. conglutinans race 2 54008]
MEAFPPRHQCYALLDERRILLQVPQRHPSLVATLAQEVAHFGC